MDLRNELQQAEARIAELEADLARATELGERSREEQRVNLSLLGQVGRMASIGYWAVDLNSNEVDWSPEVFRIHDLEPGPNPTLEEAMSYYPPGAAEEIEESLGRMVEDGSDYNPELPLITATGRRIWVRAWGEIERDVQGNPARIVGLFQDVTNQVEEREAVELREARLTLAIDGAKDGVWDWMPKTGEVVFSSGWKAILGYQDHEVANELDEWSSRLHPDDAEPTNSAVGTSLGPGGKDSYRAEFRMRHRDGHWTWILARGQVVERDEEGHAVRMTGTHTDISDQVELREELVRAKEGAEAAARTKSEFLATMSHEIRTPMNGILGMAQLLLDGQLEEDVHDQVRMIYESGSSLLNILNDILDLSKLESGKLELESRAFDVAECIQETIELLRPALQDKPVELLFDAPTSFPEGLVGDPGRTRQLLLNLIGNAIKFTGEGHVQVRASFTEGPAAEAPRLRVSVEDSGIGIPACKLESLFESFRQADASTTRRFGGTGLGLAICKNLVEAMAGKIGCDSEEGVGSTFWFELPMASAPVAAAPEEAPAPRDSDQLGLLALVVEDNPVNQLVARRMLERLGCTVAVASDGSEALEKLRDGNFQVVFMDCQMPRMDGYEATRRIRDGECGPAVSGIPIVAMTANAMEEDRDRCLASGMTEYVSKPVERARLVEATLRALTLTRDYSRAG